jgi:hypothetical protein
MGKWQTTATLTTSAAPEAIWARAYADASAWPAWNPEIAAASLDGRLRLGARATIRFRTGLHLRFTVVEFEDGLLFTDEARLPLARMGHRHRLEALPGGGTRLENTIYMRGPLSWLWVRVVGRRASRALPEGQQAIVTLGYGPKDADSL